MVHYNMSKIQSLEKHKQNKLWKTIERDMEQLIPVLEKSIKLLGNYKHYIPIRSILTTMDKEVKTLAMWRDKVKTAIKKG